MSELTRSRETRGSGIDDPDSAGPLGQLGMRERKGASTRVLSNDFHELWKDIREDGIAAFERVGASGW